ncbi:MAG TPA: glycerate kinase [Nitrospirota bacterium]
MIDREPLMAIFNAALSAADPYRAVTRLLRIEGGKIYAGAFGYNLGDFERIIVVGAGKAAARMAAAVEDVLGDALDGGIVIVKYGHRADLKTIEQVEAAHPIPDKAGAEGTQRILGLIRGADEKTLVVCLLSGGGSALLVAPLPGITLEDKQRTTDLLLRAGANVTELNTIRKHLSVVKGGRLAEAVHPASLITLILSDVIGDRLDVIASGPTVPDETNFRDALGVIHTYSLERNIPDSVFSLLHMGVAGVVPDTPKEGAAFFQKTRNVIVGSIRQSLDAARKRAAELGYEVEAASSELQGEARDAARFLAKKAIETRSVMRPGDRPRCLLSGGETTVTVKGAGKGGRNQELALTFAREVSGRDGITLLSAGTDGTDGPTDAAGAVVDGGTWLEARASGLDGDAFLEKNDSYSFFSKLDLQSGEKRHLKTGPTGTNVMDVQIILVTG